MEHYVNYETKNTENLNMWSVILMINVKEENV